MSKQEIHGILNKGFEDLSDKEQVMMARAWDEGLATDDEARIRMAVSGEKASFENEVMEARLMTAFRQKYTRSASVLGIIGLLPGWAGKIAVAATIALGFLLIRPANTHSSGRLLADTSATAFQPVDTTARDSILH